MNALGRLLVGPVRELVYLINDVPFRSSHVFLGEGFVWYLNDNNQKYIYCSLKEINIWDCLVWTRETRGKFKKFNKNVFLFSFLIVDIKILHVDVP